LPDGHEQFLRELRAHSQDLLAQVGRRRRKLEREEGTVVWEWQGSQPDDDMSCLRRWKSDQYAHEGTWDRFAYPLDQLGLDFPGGVTRPGLHWVFDRAAGR
jgi:hypothetical protein